MAVIGEIETQVARKQYRCWWCGEHIEPGESYVRWRWKDSKFLLTIKTHPECRDAWDELSTDDDGTIEQGDYARGCLCEHGNCECGE